MVASLNYELKKGTRQHDMVKDRVRERYQMSYNDMVKRWPAWRKMDKDRFEVFNAKEIERKLRSRTDNDLELKVPFTWAMQQTALMYLSSVFLGRDPVFQYTARHGEGQDQVQGMEALIDYQKDTGTMEPSLYTWLSDSLDYGLGIVGEYWVDEVSRARRRVRKAKTIGGLEIPGTERIVDEFMEIPGYSGNKLFSVRPYDFFPDTRVPIRDLQSGEFCGRIVDMGYHEIKSREATGEYFNVEELKRNLENENTSKSGFVRERGNLTEDKDIPDNETFSVYGSKSDRNTNYVEVFECYIRIIPKEWGFGKSTYPEMWVFTLANGTLMIGCRPYGMYHDRFPFHALEYEVNGHHVHARGMNEIIRPLNDVMTWMFNSHIYNVRKTINNEIVVDPSRVNMQDFKRKGPGRLIRLKAQAYGTDPGAAIHQLNMNDVTRGNLNDMVQVKNLMQMIIGVNDSLMGALGTGGRKTATEVRSSNTFGVNRLKTTAEYQSSTGWASLSRNLVQSTQQLYTGEQMFKIAGNSLDQKNFVRVTPELIAGFYDYVPVDGTLPVDRVLQANLYKEMLLGAGRLGPQFLARYDIGKIFEHILRLSGIKNVDSFKINAQVVPDGAGGGDAGFSQATGTTQGGNPGETLPALNSPQNPAV